MRVVIHYGGHSSEAEAKRLRRVRPTWYAHNEHMGIIIHEEQRIGSPSFDEGSPMTWEAIDDGQ